MAGTISLTKASKEAMMIKESNNTSGGVRFAYMRQGPYRELEFYQCVTKIVVTTTILQNFAFPSFLSIPP